MHIALRHPWRIRYVLYVPCLPSCGSHFRSSLVATIGIGQCATEHTETYPWVGGKNFWLWINICLRLFKSYATIFCVQLLQRCGVAIISGF